MIGTSLNQYRITAKLGEGGMGQVYRATDTKLGREVAIKLLPATFSRDPRYLSRFEREAKALAALNHPHIAAIYGFEADQGTHFLVLELVEGETLAERLRRGPLPVKEALTIARQMAEALQEAHEEGIIHRDLKPGNVKITPNGRVKVLDFGLAKMEQAIFNEPGQGVPPASDPEAATLPADTTLPSYCLSRCRRSALRMRACSRCAFRSSVAWRMTSTSEIVPVTAISKYAKAVMVVGPFLNP